MNDQEIQEKKDIARRKAIERANAYMDMMNMWAWKDFMNEVLIELQTESVNKMFEKPFDRDSVLEARGTHDAISKIKNEIGYILEGGK